MVDQFKFKLFGNQNLSQVKLETDDDVFLFLQQNAKNKGSTWRTFALLSLFPFVAILFHDVRWA